MNTKQLPRGFIIAAGLAVVAIAGLAAWRALQGSSGRGPQEERPTPVVVAPVEHGPIELRRTFTGTLEAQSSFVVASKVAGRIEIIGVDIGDPVKRGQVVAQLDNAEFEQAVAQAKADLAVAQANVAGARSLAEVAARDVERLAGLRESGATSQSQYDTADATRVARQAELHVTEAQTTRAEAALATARIRLGYARVVANWTGDDEDRVVAERFVEEGDTVSPNAPLLRIVDIDRVNAVFHVTERDYAHLQPGQAADFVTDAFPSITFHGKVERIAPVFRETTRQARVEVIAPNPYRRLRPGMFVRATLLLEQIDNATIVPESALTRRKGQEGVFLVDESGPTARWVPVRTGVRDNGRAEILDAALNGRVIVLGQHLLEDGSAITITEDSGS